MKEPAAEQRIQDVVRGVRPWTDLAAIGIAVEDAGDGVSMVADSGVVVMPGLLDFVHGFHAYRDRPIDCRMWASILLAGSAFLDLAPLEGSRLGEQLLEGLWDAAETGEITAELSAHIDELMG